uniref:FAD-binding FR-type domain-containing protein n=1 Tax=Ciona savignyi TaxID=51511 RepID=H2Y784_CIOSA
MRLWNYIVNDGLRLFIWVSWLSTNVVLFYLTFMYYYNGLQFYYLHQMLGYGLCISRASAACINLNSSFLLFPMCRGVVTFLRGLPRGMGRQTRRLLDRGRSFHILCGYLICVLAGVHCAAHAYNIVYFSKHYNPRYKDLNVAKYSNQNPLFLLGTSLSGLTGLLLVVCLIVISSFASRPIRRKNHNRFWKSHHVFIIFYLLLLIHAMDGVIKYQTNINEHKPGCFVITNQPNETIVVPEPEPEPGLSGKPDMVSAPEPVFPEPFPKPEMNAMPSKVNGCIIRAILNSPHQMAMPEPEPHPHVGAADRQNETRIWLSGSWVEVMECVQPPPKFSSCPQEAWWWLCAPLIIYVIERIGRHVRSSRLVTTIVGVIEHPCDVIELRLYRKGFVAKPGQCIWVRCPAISTVENHPFSLTSVPCKADPTFGIHVKVLGDWTGDLREIATREVEPVVQVAPVERVPSKVQLESNRLDEMTQLVVDDVIRPPRHSLQRHNPPISEVQLLNGPDVTQHSDRSTTGCDLSIAPSTWSLYDNCPGESPSDHRNSEVPSSTVSESENIRVVLNTDSDIETQTSENRKTTLSNQNRTLRNIQSSESVKFRSFPNIPVLCVEGPTGGAMEDVFKYKVALCVAGGIGVTPFASVLNALLNDEEEFCRMKLNRLYLVWVCKDARSFAWFASLLLRVQEKLWMRNRPDFLTVRLHITASNLSESLNSTTLQSTLRHCHIYHGRPDLELVFNEVKTATRQQRLTVGVFSCGPRPLISAVKTHCLETKWDKVRFIFNKEAF